MLWTTGMHRADACNRRRSIGPRSWFTVCYNALSTAPSTPFACANAYARTIQVGFSMLALLQLISRRTPGMHSGCASVASCKAGWGVVCLLDGGSI
jgi:hypothetical protein